MSVWSNEAPMPGFAILKRGRTKGYANRTALPIAPHHSRKDYPSLNITSNNCSTGRIDVADYDYTNPGRKLAPVKQLHDKIVIYRIVSLLEPPPFNFCWCSRQNTCFRIRNALKAAAPRVHLLKFSTETGEIQLVYNYPKIKINFFGITHTQHEVHNSDVNRFL